MLLAARRSAVALLLLATLFAGATPLRAQEHQIIWSDIACSEDKIKVPQALRCRATAEYSGVADAISGSSGQAVFRRWIAFGTVDRNKFYYYAIEGVSVGGYIVANDTLERTITGLSPDAKGATSFSPLARLNGGDYQRFFSSEGQNCVGVRKTGPSHRAGYKWVLSATKCVAKGKSISDEEIGQFIAGANFAG
jgi:hypothetical protein